MSERPMLARAKQEPTEDSTNEAPPPSHLNSKDRGAPIHIPDARYLVKLGDEQARTPQVNFPPGCPVLYTDTSREPLVVSKGSVAEVFIDISPNSSRDFFYKIARGRRVQPVMATGQQLQWAPPCRVWFRLPEESSSGDEWARAVIRGSYQVDASASPQYSIELVEPLSGIFHGVSQHLVQYRARGSDPPMVERTSQVAAPMTAETVEEDSPSPSIVNVVTAPAPDDHSPSPNHPPPRPYVETPLINASVVEERLGSTNPTTIVKSDNDAISLSSVPKTPLSSQKQQPPEGKTRVEVFHDVTSVYPCTAELGIPLWMGMPGLNDSIVDLISSAFSNASDCHACILERKLKHPCSVPPQQCIFLYGNDAVAVEQGCILVSELLGEYVKEKDKPKLQRMLITGWRKNSESLEQEAVKQDHDDSYSDPPPKKAKLMQSAMGAESDAMAGTETVASGTAPMRAKQDEEASQTCAGGSSSPSERTSDASDGAFVREEQTFVMKVPRRLDRAAVINALIGAGGTRKRSLVRQTRCKIKVLGFKPGWNVTDEEPLEVQVTGLASDLVNARQTLEDTIIMTVGGEDVPRVLYNLARENNYGSSSGYARYQRSPGDRGKWVWMAVVTLPSDFQNYKALFLSSNGSGLKRLMRETGCWAVSVIDGAKPPYVYVEHSSDALAVNNAVDAVKKRVHWAKQRHQSNGERGQQ